MSWSSQLRRFDERAASLGADLWSGKIILDGIEYAAQVPKPRISVVLDPYAGERESAELIVRVLKSDHPAEPAEEAVLQYDGRDWKIRSVTGGNEVDAQWILRCEPKN